MIGIFPLYRLNREYKALCEQYEGSTGVLAVRKALVAERRLTTAGSLLVISQLQFSEEGEDFEATDAYKNWFLPMANNLADIRKDMKCTPEEIQYALQQDEESLEHNWEKVNPWNSH